MFFFWPDNLHNSSYNYFRDIQTVFLSLWVKVSDYRVGKDDAFHTVGKELVDLQRLAVESGESLLKLFREDVIRGIAEG